VDLYSGKIPCPLIITEIDSEYVFTGEDMLCEPNGTRTVVLKFNNDKTLIKDVAYAVSLRVQNPTTLVSADPWHMQSYDDLGQEMDEVYVPGFGTVPPVDLWSVENLVLESKGNTRVQMEFTLVLPHPLSVGEDVNILAPLGFGIRTQGTEDSCQEFEYLDNAYSPLPADFVALTKFPFPDCKCAYVVDKNDVGILNCAGKFKVRKKRSDYTNRVEFHPARQPLAFRIQTLNPRKQADEIDWFWIVQHTLGDGLYGTVIKSEGMVECWTVQAQMEDLVVLLTGPFQRASSVSELVFGFVPVQDAMTLVVEALAPAGFDFSRALVLRPFELPDEILEDRQFVVNNCGMQATILWNITVTNIRLGRLGGQTVFDVTTWWDGRMRDKQDQVIDFRQGFRLPGEILTETKVLNSFYAEANYKYPLQAMFPARQDEMSRARLEVIFTQPVMSQEKLYIECGGEKPYALLDMMVQLQQDNSRVDVAPRLLSPTFLMTTVRPGEDRKETAVLAQIITSLMFWVMPTDGENLWTIWSQDRKALPTNTNDGIEDGFLPVQQVEIDFLIDKSPPKAYVDIVLVFLSYPIGEVRELVIVSPIGFRFPVLCGDLCFPGPDKLAGTPEMRRSAILRSNEGEAITHRILSPFNLKVETPEFNSSSIEWAVEVKTVADKTLAWGLAPGFPVDQMPFASIMFGGVLNLENVFVAVTFTIQPQDEGLVTLIKVLGPDRFEMRCSTRQSIQPLSLPGMPECADEAPLTLRTKVPIPPGKHAFMVMANIPDTLPPTNDFAILAASEEGRVVDAAYGVKGKNYKKLPIQNPTFERLTERPKALNHVKIRIGIEFMEDFSPRSNYSFKAVLITFPENITQDIWSAASPTYEVKNLNASFPAASGDGWLDLSDSSRLKVIVRDDKPAWFPYGNYEWEFPVALPSVENYPNQYQNYWRISVCDSRLCNEPDGYGTMVTFVVAGFQLFDFSTELDTDALAPAWLRSFVFVVLFLLS
jgi:hypothetical protein